MPPIDPQEQFWRLTEARLDADSHRRRAEALLESARALEADVETRYRAFAAAHDGESFLLFRPNWIEAMADPTVEPLFPAEEDG